MEFSFFSPAVLAILLTGNLFMPSVSAAEAASGTIKLPKPVYSSRTSVETALRARRSIRNYKDNPLTLSELSQLLWAAQGITERGKRTVPSAGGLYPLDIYIAVGNVTNLDAGIYVYRPDGHAIMKVADGDKRAELSRAALGQSAIEKAPITLLITAVYQRTTMKYRDRGIRYVDMEAGHAAENVYLQAVSLKLGTVVIGAFDDNAVKNAANLSVQQQPLYLMPVGKR